MDDFIILAKTMKKIVEKYNLYFKWSKCDFNVEEILILVSQTSFSLYFHNQ